MAIDRIGKGGAPPTPETQGTGGAEKKGPVEKPFHVERPDAAKRAQEVQSTSPSTPLERLRAGEIDANGYIDLKVDEATRSLPHGLSPHEIDEIKKVLRTQMATDPGLVDLVRTATGELPKPPED
jgi:hypothetical protein